MSKYDKLTRAQMIKQLEDQHKEIEDQDKEIEDQDKEIEDQDKKIKQEESLWSTDEGKAKRFRSEEDLKLAHRIETLDDIINTPSSLHSSTGFTLEKFQWLLEHFIRHIQSYEDEIPLFHVEDSKKSGCRKQMQAASTACATHGYNA